MTDLLNKLEIEQFINDGYIKVENIFSADTAKQVREILWEDIPFNKQDSSTWIEPVVRLGMYHQKPFIESINNPKLHALFDQLVGKNKWVPSMAVGSFPVRFPSNKQPNDLGMHVDTSFPGDDPSNFFEWKANIKSKGRGLLMLILYSDVSIDDAPTVICKGSHIGVAQLLRNEGDRGLSFMEIANKLDTLPTYEQVYATGKAGTIYLCHPFLVHSAQAHKGSNPKFMAQPPLLLKRELTISDSDVGYSPVEQAIRLAIK